MDKAWMKHLENFQKKIIEKPKIKRKNTWVTLIVRLKFFKYLAFSSKKL